MDVPNNESRNEYLIESLINDEDINDYEPQSRNEQFLKDLCSSKEITLVPESRFEVLLSKLHEKISNGQSDPFNTNIERVKYNDLTKCIYETGKEIPDDSIYQVCEQTTQKLYLLITGGSLI